MELDIDMVEFDVRKTKDNVLVVRIPRAVLGIGEKVDFEFKWNERRGGLGISSTFRKAYPNAEVSVVTPGEASGFLGDWAIGRLTD